MKLIQILFRLIRSLIGLAVFIPLAFVIGIIMAPARFLQFDFVIPVSLALIQAAHKVVNILSGAMLFIFGISLEVFGDIPRTGGPYIIMSNHISWLDMFVIAWILHAIPTTAISKKSNFWLPIFGQVIWLLFVVWVVRYGGDKEKNRKNIEWIAGICKKFNLNLLIFPEGTRTKTGEIQEFKFGGFARAIASQMNIIPIRIKGIYLSKWEFTLFRKVTVIIGDQIDITQFTEPEGAALCTHKIITSM